MSMARRGSSWPANFPSTQWSMVANARDVNSPSCRDSLNKLINVYWRPVYGYIRVDWVHRSEEARDLTQDFFTELLDGDVLRKYDRERGRFRVYLKTVLRHFLMDCKKGAERKKRGGEQQHFSLAFTGEESAFDMPAKDETPEQAFDRIWKGALFARAVDELERQLTQTGRELSFRVFQRYELLGTPNENTYGVVGKEFGLAALGVKAHLKYARRRLKTILQNFVAATVVSSDDLTEELRELFGL